MKSKLNILLIIIFMMSIGRYAISQVPDAGQLTGIHVVTESEMNSISNPSKGAMVFNDDKATIYQFDGFQWKSLKNRSYIGKFILNSTGNKTISEVPFTPSKVRFMAYANVETYNLNADNGIENNHSGLDNSFGGMQGYAQNESGNIEQQVIYVGGHGNSINDISRYASDSYCIGIRYGNRNGDNLGLTTASFTSFNTDGFTINVDNLGDNLVVLYHAYE